MLAAAELSQTLDLPDALVAERLRQSLPCRQAFDGRARPGVIPSALTLAAQQLLSPIGRLALAPLLAGLRAGTAADQRSREAFLAWAARYGEPPEGLPRRFLHYAEAAAWQSVPDGVLQKPMPLGATRGVLPAKLGAYWQPAERRSESWLATLPIFIRAGERQLITAELLAWPYDRPDRWGICTGAFDLLGAHTAEHALCTEQPVRVYRTPAAWNRAGGGGASGVCVLDWDSVTARLLLRWAKGLIGDDRTHAQELQRRVDRNRPTVHFVLRGAAA